MKGIGRWLMAVGVIGALSFAAPSRLSAQNEAVIVIVESANASIRADTVRAALRRAGVTVLSLTDEGAGAVSDVLTLAIRADGRTATAQFRTTQRLEVRFLRTRRPDARGRWLTAPLAGLIRATRAAGVQTNAEVLDPWSATPRTLEVTEVVDPWEGEPPARVIATALAPAHRTEVLDPWRDQPDVRPAALPTNNGIVNPWAAERGEQLDSPRPRN